MPRGVCWCGRAALAASGGWCLCTALQPPGILVPGSHPGLGVGHRGWRVSQETPAGVQVGGIGAGVGIGEVSSPPCSQGTLCGDVWG